MEVVLTINDQQVVLKKIPLRKYAELLGAFQELPKHLDLVSGKTNEEFIQNLPTLLSTCYPDIVRVLKVATDMTEEQIDEMGLDDFAKVIVAILELNKFTEVYQTIKKVMPQPKKELVEAQAAT